MDEFLNLSAEKILFFKKNVLQKKHAVEFLQNLCNRGDSEKMKSELKKYLTKDESNLDQKNKSLMIS